MTDLDCKNELVLRERGGELSPAERVALEAHLAQCGSCRLSRLLGHDFDAERTLEADDGMRIAALSAAAERWALGATRSIVPAAPQRRRVRVVLLAVAAALAAVGASAAAGTWSHVFDSTDTAPVAVAPPALERRAASVPRAPAVEQAPPTTEKVESRSRVAPPSSVTAASLLADASAARRAGDAERAIALYRRLENDFPRSPEAGLAALPLGGLLLDRGDARAALAQFDRHVRAGQSSRLLPEALYGRGRCLTALGSRAEERRTWTHLLEEFPQSPYAGHARRRLAELTPAD
jgi:TolA-binding protein